MAEVNIITLTRLDLESENPNAPNVSQDIDPDLLKGMINREIAISKLSLPENAIIKLYHEGKLIPWSMAMNVSSLEIQVFRPRQNILSTKRDALPASDSLIKEKVKELEDRILSLEAVADPAIICVKTERDLQILSKQISFLKKRMDEAEQAEWIKKT